MVRIFCSALVLAGISHAWAEPPPWDAGLPGHAVVGRPNWHVVDYRTPKGGYRSVLLRPKPSEMPLDDEHGSDALRGRWSVRAGLLVGVGYSPEPTSGPPGGELAVIDARQPRLKLLQFTGTEDELTDAGAIGWDRKKPNEVVATVREDSFRSWFTVPHPGPHRTRRVRWRFQGGRFRLVSSRTIHNAIDAFDTIAGAVGEERRGELRRLIPDPALRRRALRVLKTALARAWNKPDIVIGTSEANASAFQLRPNGYDHPKSPVFYFAPVHGRWRLIRVSAFSALATTPPLELGWTHRDPISACAPLAARMGLGDCLALGQAKGGENVPAARRVHQALQTADRGAIAACLRSNLKPAQLGLGAKALRAVLAEVAKRSGLFKVSRFEEQLPVLKVQGADREWVIEIDGHGDDLFGEASNSYWLGLRNGRVAASFISGHVQGQLVGPLRGEWRRSGPYLLGAGFDDSFRNWPSTEFMVLRETPEGVRVVQRDRDNTPRWCGFARARSVDVDRISEVWEGYKVLEASRWQQLLRREHWRFRGGRYRLSRSGLVHDSAWATDRILTAVLKGDGHRAHAMTSPGLIKQLRSILSHHALRPQMDGNTVSLRNSQWNYTASLHWRPTAAGWRLNSVQTKTGKIE